MCGGPDDPPSASQYRTPESLKPVPKADAKAGDVVVEEFPITIDGYTYQWGRIAYVKGRSPKPVILVHHNYAGLKQFDVDQACFIAKAGYVGVAVDCYKETEKYTYKDRNLHQGRPVDFDEFCNVARIENIFDTPNPLESPIEELEKLWALLGKDPETNKAQWQSLRHFIGAFRQMRQLLCSPDLWRRLMAANLEAASRHHAVLSGSAGAIGYCLGGQSCLEQLRAGHEIQAICLFHGLLHSRPTHSDEEFNPLRRISAEEYQSQYAVPNNYTVACSVLVQNGANDTEVPHESVVEWMEEMDAHNIDWRLEHHARGPHGFALALGSPGGDHYTEVIDRRSSIAMLSLFAETWPAVEQLPVECNACGTKLGQLISSTEHGNTKPGKPTWAWLAVAVAVVAVIAARSRVP